MNNNKNTENKINYLPLCMCLGISLGTAIGAATGHLPLYMSIGMSIGVCIGAALDAKNRTESEEISETDDKEENDPSEP